MRYFAIFSALLLTSACTHEINVAASPATAEYSSYATKVSGKFALFVDPANMNQDAVPMTGNGCDMHTFPIKAADAFKTSTIKTMQSVFETVDIVDAPLTRDQLQQKGYRGMVSVRAENLSARIGITYGFWTGTATGVANVTLSALVDGPTDRLFGTSVSAERSSSEDTYAGCGTAADATGKATAAAINYALQQLAEHISDAPKLRQTAVPAAAVN